MRVGVPKESWPGERRVAATPDSVKKLRKLGFEVVVEREAGLAAGFDDDAYAGAASRLARDPARLASLRSSLRDRVRQSPIMDAPANCRRMEDAIRAMWREWCAKA